MGDHTHFVVQQCAAAFGLLAMPARSGMYGRLYEYIFNNINFRTNYTSSVAL